MEQDQLLDVTETLAWAESRMWAISLMLSAIALKLEDDESVKHLAAAKISAEEYVKHLAGKRVALLEQMTQYQQPNTTRH